MDNEGYEELA